MASGSSRYLRYILFAFFGLAVIYFISSSSTQRLPSKSDILNGAGKASNNAPLKAGTSGGAAAPAVPAATAAVTPNLPGGLAAATADGPRANATFVTLARNSDLWEIARSIRQVEDRFNRKFHYDWVFLNDKPFDATFKKVTSSLVSGTTHYGEIPTEHWSFPAHIDQERAKKVREDMAAKKIIYGDSISYRHMCRFESGFFFRQPLMLNYEYYWRVEPSIELFCDINYDVFKYMADNKKKYSFVLSLYEYVETIPTLWESTKKFMKAHPEHISENNSMGFLSDDGGDSYNHCHMWSNFEVGNLNWLRSKAYVDYFESLDQDGGFFYERWGDAPVHSIAASLLLKKDEIHFFNDIAYYHVPFTHCPTGEKTRLDLKCHCNPKDNFDWKGYSCTSRFFEINGMEKPEGYENQQD
ncbi:probable mannosyltransferase involved in N-linked and O-linked glycosylation [Rhynchosporium secalis]|uniref:Probable mannosyltransferase involved in N-linked and O-linked glycosylation n=1 Tax=Rhynchosporium secalis TaxID=38038 RepID=A0A1E1M881_RHYSE|nr:probable mannosyltransferase involved in N-linked and O-linked glycosylation [Rhynchosporium secalis]